MTVLTTECRMYEHATCPIGRDSHYPCECGCHGQSLACKWGAHAFCLRENCRCRDCVHMARQAA